VIKVDIGSGLAQLH